jgi:HEAT repeat protein
MTLKRLMIALAVLVFLAGVGIAWLWQYAYSPQGRARVIIAQLKNDESSPRGWMLKHHVLRPVPPPCEGENCEDPRFALDFAAAGEMVKLGHEVLPIVIDALQDKDGHVRMMAIRACGQFRDPAAIQPLVKCFRESRHDEVEQLDFQPRCVHSLIEIGPTAFASVFELAKESFGDLRQEIPRTIAQKWETASISYLVKLLKHPEGDVRVQAAMELGKFKDRCAVEPLIGLLGDPVGFVRAGAAGALGDIADDKAIPSLLKTFHDKRNENGVRISAAGALARMGRDEEHEYLLVMLHSTSWEDRVEVAVELGTRKIKGTLEALLSLLGDSNFTVRLSALRAIGELQDPRAIPAVRKLLNDSDPTVQLFAADALEKLGVKPSRATQPGKP